MKPQAGRKPSLYEQLIALPEGLTGEIINGQLRTQPRPAWPHILAGSRLGADIEGAYGRGLSRSAGLPRAAVVTKIIFQRRVGRLTVSLSSRTDELSRMWPDRLAGRDLLGQSGLGAEGGSLRKQVTVR